MFIYIFTLAISLLIAKFCFKERRVIEEYNVFINNYSTKRIAIEKKQKLITFFLASLPFIFLASIRLNIGSDVVGTYTNSFNKVLSGEDVFPFPNLEISQNLIMYFSAKIFHSLNFFLAINSIIVCLGFFYISYKLNANIYITILFFFFSEMYFASYNNVRSISAITICMLGFPFILKQKFWHFLGFVLLATTFHQAAIMSIVLYPLARMNFFRKRSLLLFFLSTLSIPILFNILIIILKNTRYSYFLTQFIGTDRMGPLNIFITIINFSIAYYIFKKLKTNISFTFFCANLISLVIIVLSFYLKSNELTTRMNGFFLYYNFLMYGRLYNQGKIQYKQITILILVFYIFLTFYHVQVKNYHGVLPYESIFNLIKN